MHVFGPVDPRITGDIKDPVRTEPKKYDPDIRIGEICEAFAILNRAADQIPSSFKVLCKGEPFYNLLMKP